MAFNFMYGWGWAIWWRPTWGRSVALQLSIRYNKEKLNGQDIIMVTSFYCFLYNCNEGQDFSLVASFHCFLYNCIELQSFTVDLFAEPPLAPEAKGKTSNMGSLDFGKMRCNFFFFLFFQISLILNFNIPITIFSG